VSLRQVSSCPVMGGRWVGSHGPIVGGLWLRLTSGPLEHRPGMPEGHGPAEWRSCVSGLLAW
jgi:hypothetical protein